MLSNWAWAALLGPLALVCAGALPRLPRDRDAVHAAIAAAIFAFAAAVAAVVAVALNGPIRTATLGVAGIGFAVYLDVLSAAMFALVSFIGAIVTAYSRNYLNGDPGQERFVKRLCLTLAAVLILIVSGNLLQFTLAWVAASIGLHGLLIFYPRQPAVLAARKKFLSSRLGDLCLIGAMGSLYAAFGSLDYAAIFSGASASGGGSEIPAAAGLLVCAAMLKSAQFPLHGWLLEVMETPTPVSALLHAGIINAGGFLVLRFAPVIGVSIPALQALAIVGAVTALFGSAVMLTQTSIKVSLAYSTIAQMGFMMLECGLGAFSAAFLHIVAHSLYKAHAFLSSGGVIDIARASWSPSPGGQPHPARLVIAILAVLFATSGIGALFGATLTGKPGVFVRGAVVAMGRVHLLAQGIDERPNVYVVARTVGAAVLVVLVYFTLQFLVERALAGSLPPTRALQGPLDLAIVVCVVLSFSALTIFQSLVPRKADTPRWQAFYAHVSNGFYVNTLANRWVLRFWPSPPPRSRAAGSTLESRGAQI